MLSHKGNIYTTYHFARFSAEERPERMEEPEVEDEYKETSSGHSRPVAHTNFQDFQQHAQNLCSPKPDQVPAWKGGGGRHTIPPTPSCRTNSIVSFCVRERQFFSKSV